MNRAPPTCNKLASSGPSKLAPVITTCPVIFAPLRYTTLKLELPMVR